MKKLLTILSVIMLLSMIPIELKAWGTICLEGSLVGGWSADYALTKLDNNGNSWSATLDASALGLNNGTTYSFKLHDTTYNKWWGDGYLFDFTNASSNTKDISEDTANMSFKHNSLYNAYKISAGFANEKWTLTITGVSVTFDPAGCEFEGTQNVTLTSSTGNDIYYTTDGSTPTTSSSHISSGSYISLAATTTVKAGVIDNGNIVGIDSYTFTKVSTSAVYIGGCIGGKNSSWNTTTYSMTYDSTEDAWYYDINAANFSAWTRASDEGSIGVDFRFREVYGGTTYYVFSTGDADNAHTQLTSSYQNLVYNSTGAGNRFVGIAEVANATNYRVWYKVDNGTRKAKVVVTAIPTITFSPASQTYNTPTINVTLTSSDNSTIYYTTNGATPTANSSTVASGGTVTISGTRIIKAGALVDGTIQGIVSSTYTYDNGASTSTGIYYLVGNFMSDDGNSVNTINKIFRMKAVGNNKYSFDIPATLNAKFYVVDDASHSFGPLAGGYTWDLTSSVPSTDGTSSGTMTNDTSDGHNCWNMTDRGITSDGMYTVTITDDGNGTPISWEIKHTSLTRVVYFLPDQGVAQPAYMTRNSGATGDNKFFGNVYLNEDQQCFVLGNIKGKSAWTSSSQPMPTADKLYKQGNGGGYAVGSGTNPEMPSGYSDWHKVYPALKNTGFKVQPAGAMTLEYNPSKGQDEEEKYSDNYNIGGEVMRASGDPMTIIESMAVIGNGVGTDWNLSNARAMTYNSTLKCWEVTIVTASTESIDNKFRFVANGSWDNNWYENGTAATDKARVPYTGTGEGHAATEADVNVVEKTTDAHVTTERDIIFNRPVGTWTIRFYTDTESSSGGNFFTYKYYYTITGEASTAPEATLSPGTTTWNNYTRNEAKPLTVTLENANGYNYSFGTDTSLGSYGTGTSFGSLLYDGTSVYLGSTLVAENTRTVTIHIQGTDGSNVGTQHDYTYTFIEPIPVTATITTQGGFYINKVMVEVEYTGNAGTPLYWKIGGAPTTSDNLVSYTDDHENFYNRKFMLSTPGQLYVGDGTNTSDPVTFDFTYSTSENYKNYYNNGKDAQTVAAGGGADATNIFLKKSDFENLRIYAYDWTYDQALRSEQNTANPGLYVESTKGVIKVSEEGYYIISADETTATKVAEGTTDAQQARSYADTGFATLLRDPHVKLTNDYPGALMTDSRSIEIGGETYYYLTLPYSRLHASDDQVGIVVSRIQDTHASNISKESDKYKYPAYGGVVLHGNSSFIYNSVDKGGNNYINSLVDISTLVVHDDNANMVYFTNPDNWEQPWCYAFSDSGGNNGAWPGRPMVKIGNYWCMSFPNGYDKVVFNNNSDSQKTGDLGYGYGVKYYDKTGTFEGSEPELDKDDYDTFIKEPSEVEVEYTRQPNGEDYYRVMSHDKTILLDPTWGGAIKETTTNNLNTEENVPNWNGVTGNDNEHSGYRKMVTGELSQLVNNLDKNKTYTVQAIVRGWGEENAKLRLTVGDGTPTEIDFVNPSAKSYVNKNGRVDDRYTEGPDPDDENIMHGADYGWMKIEASGRPSQVTGNLQITLTPTFGETKKYDLADVILLEDANTAGHYWTKLPTDETSVAAIKAGEIDMTNRTTYNAFSFFDRNEGNPNAIIKASNRTVIGLRKGIADMQAADGTVTKDAVDHIQSRNTISQNSDGTWSGRYLYLYDESDATQFDTDYIRSACNTYGATVRFTMIGAKYDRKFISGNHSTIFLPYSLPTSQLKAAGFTQLANVKEISDVNSDITLNTWDLTQAEPTDYSTVAGEGYIVVAGNISGKDYAALEAFYKPDGGIAVQPASDGQTTEQTGLVGNYEYCLRYQKDGNYMNYSYQNNKFRALSTSGAGTKPFRATFAVPLGSNASRYTILNPVFVDVDDIVPTAIDGVETVAEGDSRIYTLDGRLVSNSGKLSELPRGIYVRDGRKIVVK